MNESLHDAIDRLLREDAGRPVRDDGFSLRLMRTLPAPRVTRPWLRPALVLFSAALGSALAWLLAPGGISVAQGFVDLARLQSQTPSAVVALGVALAMGVTAIVLAADDS